MSNSSFTFRKFTPADLPLLHGWLNRPHVADEWDGPLTLAQVREKYEPALLSAQVSRYVACLDGDPVGFIQSYIVMGDPEFWPDERDPGAVGVDMFLADPDKLGQGIGTAMLRAFIDKLFADPAVTRVQIDPAPDNARAVRCYEKVGFVKKGLVTTPDGPALLMALERPAP